MWNINNINMSWKNFVKEQKKHYDLYFQTKYLNDSFVQKIDQNTIFIAVPTKKASEELCREGLDKLFARCFEQRCVVNFVINNQNKTNKNQKTELSFDNYVVGDFNRLAYEVAHKILQKNNKWGFIFIYSDPGLGKTYLLNLMKKHNKTRTLIYQHAPVFGTRAVESMGDLNKMSQLKRSFAENDIILIDDVQVLGERTKTNEVLFEIINTAQQRGADLVFASDKHPDELVGFDNRLKSRFLSGLQIKITRPDLKTAHKIIKLNFEKFRGTADNVDLNVIEKIAQVFRHDIRKLESTVKQIVFSLSGKKETKINLELLNEIFRDVEFNVPDRISIKKIKSLVAKHFGLTYNSLSSKSRKKEVVMARYYAIYLSRLLTNESHAAIAKYFKAKNHTTAVNAVKKVRKEMQKNPQVKKEITLLRESCNKS